MSHAHRGGSMSLSFSVFALSTKVSVLDWLAAGRFVYRTCHKVLIISRFEVFSALCKFWKKINRCSTIFSVKYLAIKTGLWYGCTLSFNDGWLQIVVRHLPYAFELFFFVHLFFLRIIQEIDCCFHLITDRLQRCHLRTVLNLIRLFVLEWSLRLNGIKSLI